MEPIVALSRVAWNLIPGLPSRRRVFGKNCPALVIPLASLYPRIVLNDVPAENPVSEPGPKINLAKILDEEDDSFRLEYPTPAGGKSFMRLDASTYEGAIREAKNYLGVGEDDRDEKGNLWQFD